MQLSQVQLLAALLMDPALGNLPEAMQTHTGQQ